MGKSKSLLFLLLSVLLLFKIFSFTSICRQSNLPSPTRVYHVVVLNLALLASKRQHDNVFPAVGFSYTHPSADRKTVQHLPPIVFDVNDKVVLSEKNFSNFMAKNHRVMVVFYTSGLKVAEEYAVRAKKLTGAEVVAEVDIDEEKTLAEKYKIVRIPSIYFFPGGANLRDMYFNEWIPEDSRNLVEVEGKLIRRSDEDEMESRNKDQEQMLGLVYDADAKWDGVQEFVKRGSSRVTRTKGIDTRMDRAIGQEPVKTLLNAE